MLGIRLGLIAEGVWPNANALAEGMSAVRGALRAAGGNIGLRLKLGQEDAPFRNFVFDITLPASLFEPAPYTKSEITAYKSVA